MDNIDMLLEEILEEAMFTYDMEVPVEIASHLRKRLSQAGYVFYQP